MNFENMMLSVAELCDGRSFSDAKGWRWINRVRKNIAMTPPIAGFRGLYFLYKEATVKDGSKLGEPRYAVPDDYISDLNVFYDGVLLVKTPPGILDITLDLTKTGTPTWFRLMGQEFDIRPAPDEAGKEIKLLYCGFGADISGVGDEDYFMKHWPDLHIYGMSVYAARSIGLRILANDYKKEFGEEVMKLTLHNRRHWISHARIRFLNWDEYQEKRHIVFPQYSV